MSEHQHRRTGRSSGGVGNHGYRSGYKAQNRSRGANGHYGHRGDRAFTNVQEDYLENAKKVASGDRHGALVKGSNGADFRTRTSQLFSNVANQIQTQQPPENVPQNGFQSQGIYMDVDISPSNQIHYLNDFWLRLTISNPDPALTMIINQQSLLFDRIEFLPNGGDVQDTWYDLHQYLMSILPMNDERRAMEAANMGINRDTDRDSTVSPYTFTNYDNWNHGAGISLLPGEQYTFNIKTECMYKWADIFLPSLTSWPRIRYWFSQNNCQFSTSPTLGAGVYPQILNAMLVISGERLTGPQASAIKSRMAMPTISYGITMDRQILSQFTPTSNVETSDIILNSFSGEQIGFFLIFRKTNQQGQQLLSPGGGQTWAYLDNFTFKRSDGTVESYERQPTDYFYSTRFAEQWPANLALEKAVLWYNFCSDPLAAIRQGVNTGSYEFTNKEVIRFTPKSVASNLLVGAYEPIIIGLRYSQLIQQNGVLNIDKISNNY